MTANYVPWAPPGLIIALQYWTGDEVPAMRLARLIADIGGGDDSTMVALCRRFDCPMSSLARDTLLHLSKTFRSFLLRSEREGEGHPAGANGLWSGTVEALAKGWAAGWLPTTPSVFTVEADGCPLSSNWIQRLVDEHNRALDQGKLITGPYMAAPTPHVNGSLIMHLSAWVDTPSIHHTPPEEAWDIHHAATLLRQSYRTPLIANIYGSKNWSNDQLEPLSHEVAWLTSVKDNSVISWAEKALVR